MNLSDLQNEVATWSAKNFPGKLPHQPLLGACEEVGELSHAHLKCEQGIRGNAGEHYAAKCDAIADIVIYLADYCGQNQIDFDFVVSATWAQVKQRDWTKNKQDGSVA